MREDYLWDKSGEDAEIRRLENALQAFRCRESAPPVIPAKIMVAAEKPARKFFTFRFAFTFAFASSAAIVLILLGVWFRLASNEIGVPSEIAQTNTTESRAPGSNINLPNAPDVLPFKDVEVPPPPVAQRNVVKIRQTIPARQNKKPVRKPELKRQELILTEEEKYAYDQLMLALSITSSKLKIVKDKANGIEEPNDIVKTER